MITTTAAIIGAGPAGVAAAVQLKRNGVDLILLEKKAVGGLLRNAQRVENYPGFPAGISGLALASRLYKHLCAWRIPVLRRTVLALDRCRGGFLLRTSGESIRCSSLVVASGTRPRGSVDFPVDKGASRWIVREWLPLRNLRGGQAIISGAGDAAFDHALNLAGQGVEVTILDRGGRPTALGLLQERCRRSGVGYQNHAAIREVESGKGYHLAVLYSRKGRNLVIHGDRLILAWGREPELRFFPATWPVLDSGTALWPGIHFTGDVNGSQFRQAAIAAGEGVKAAMEIVRQIEES